MEECWFNYAPGNKDALQLTKKDEVSNFFAMRACCRWSCFDMISHRSSRSSSGQRSSSGLIGASSSRWTAWTTCPTSCPTAPGRSLTSTTSGRHSTSLRRRLPWCRGPRWDFDCSICHCQDTLIHSYPVQDAAAAGPSNAAPAAAAAPPAGPAAAAAAAAAATPPAAVDELEEDEEEEGGEAAAAGPAGPADLPPAADEEDDDDDDDEDEDEDEEEEEEKKEAPKKQAAPAVLRKSPRDASASKTREVDQVRARKTPGDASASKARRREVDQVRTSIDCMAACLDALTAPPHVCRPLTTSRLERGRGAASGRTRPHWPFR